MNEPLDEQYLTWLYGWVAPVKLKRASRTYWSLLRQLYRKEFVWLVPNDDNRVEDGKDLRCQFLEELQLDADSQWMSLGCSVLEMLIALARRVAVETSGQVDRWFWHFLDNLGLGQVPDSVYGHGMTEGEIDVILDRFIWRFYDYSGRGGIFPLSNPEKDQREVEIWYQFNAYLLERD